MNQSRRGTIVRFSFGRCVHPRPDLPHCHLHSPRPPHLPPLLRRRRAAAAGVPDTSGRAWSGPRSARWRQLANTTEPADKRGHDQMTHADVVDHDDREMEAGLDDEQEVGVDVEIAEEDDRRAVDEVVDEREYLEGENEIQVNR